MAASGRGRRLVAGLTGVAIVGVTALVARSALASSGDGSLDPNGRGLQVLGGREAILLEQTEHARRTAKARGLALYRLVRAVEMERTHASSDGISSTAHAISGPRGARAVALATTVLARDIEEARALRAELDRVRAERASLRNAMSSVGGTSPRFGETMENEDHQSPGLLRPVVGALLTPFGVSRDQGSGAWLFRAAATFAAQVGETVRSPGDGWVHHVSDSVAGGAAVVVSHGEAEESDAAGGDAGDTGAKSWTSIVSGLASVAVAPGERVRRGEPLGRAPTEASGRIRIETWHGRMPVDPTSLLRPR